MRKCILVKIPEDQDLSARWDKINYWNRFPAADIYDNPGPIFTIEMTLGVQNASSIRGPKKCSEIIFNERL